MSRYQEPAYGGGWSGGEKIVPLSDKEAREWVENHCSAEIYEELFGEVEE